MALQHLQRSTAQFRAPSIATLLTLESALANLKVTSQASRIAIGRRHASHQAQGRANGAKDGAGKRLGAKKTGGEYVVPGNILYKQRGTLWFPGDGCMMGRDHTIHAAVPGYVTYYRDPARHPKRKYIGVVFERHNTLPQDPNAPKRRKLGMLAYQMPETLEVPELGNLATLDSNQQPDAQSADGSKGATLVRQMPQDSRLTKTIKSVRDGEVVETKLTLSPGYQWRQANWEIGKAGLESKKAKSVKPFRPGDRFAAWRKRTARIARAAERRAMGRGGKKK